MPVSPHLTGSMSRYPTCASEKRSVSLLRVVTIPVLSSARHASIEFGGGGLATSGSTGQSASAPLSTLIRSQPHGTSRHSSGAQHFLIGVAPSSVASCRNDAPRDDGPK